MNPFIDTFNDLLCQELTAENLIPDLKSALSGSTLKYSTKNFPENYSYFIRINTLSNILNFFKQVIYSATK